MSLPWMRAVPEVGVYRPGRFVYVCVPCVCVCVCFIYFFYSLLKAVGVSEEDWYEED